MYNMYPYQFPRQQQQMQLIRVNGIDGAKAYQMPANSTSALFDIDKDIMYIKSTDGAGFPTIRTFSFVQKKEQNKVMQFVTRQQYDYLRQQLDKLKEMFNNGKQSRPKPTMPSPISSVEIQ